jgi:hypothetical protein
MSTPVALLRDSRSTNTGRNTAAPTSAPLWTRQACCGLHAARRRCGSCTASSTSPFVHSLPLSSPLLSRLPHPIPPPCLEFVLLRGRLAVQSSARLLPPPAPRYPPPPAGLAPSPPRSFSARRNRWPPPSALSLCCSVVGWLKVIAMSRSFIHSSCCFKRA